MDFKEAYKKILREIDLNKQRENVAVVGATKTKDIALIKEAAAAGLTIVGENRAQEFIAKYEKVKGLSWHFIGALQTNKVKYIVDKVDMIHSVDRVFLAQEINKQCQKINKIMPVLVEVNIGGEETKSGVLPDKLFDLIEEIIKYPYLKINGLMTVLPINASQDLYKKMNNLFLSTKASYPQLDIKWLSMGMSGDYITALRCGANMVRLGSVLFGERNYN